LGAEGAVRLRSATEVRFCSHGVHVAECSASLFSSSANACSI
jgi:hypothetical protein